MSDRPELVLYQFAFSHYNEKARWGLDFKGLSSRRENLIPGLHEGAVKKLRSDSTAVPILRDGDRVIPESAAILAHLEEIAPTPALFPESPEARRQADEWVEWLDREIGPAVRLALFHELFEDTKLAGRVFTTAQSGVKPAFYRLLFPRLVPMLRGRMRIDEANAVKARETVDAGLTRVLEASAATGYLVGDRFGVADLTAASLFMPCFFPDQIPFELPRMESSALEGWLARWHDHPGADHIRGLWAKHR